MVGFHRIRYKNIHKIFTHRTGFILLLSLSLASAHITDYTRAKYIPIVDKQILVWEEFAYVRQSANLLEYARLEDETIALTEQFSQLLMKHLLNEDSAHVRDLLDAMGNHHRVAWSLDFLGSML